MRAAGLLCALLAILVPRPAHADLWAGTGRKLTEREKWQYEFAAADVIVLAHVVEVRDDGASARLQPITLLKGAVAEKEIVARHGPGAPAPAPRLAPLTLAAGADTIAVFAFLKRDSSGLAFDDDRYVFPAGCVPVGQGRWNVWIDQAKQWSGQMRTDSLVAQADVVAHPSAVMFGPAGCSLDLGKVIKGRAGFVVPVRPFLLEDYRDLPAFVCLARGADGVFEPIPEWWGYHGLYAPANSESLAVVNAVASEARRGQAGPAGRK